MGNTAYTLRARSKWSASDGRHWAISIFCRGEYLGYRKLWSCNAAPLRHPGDFLSAVLDRAARWLAEDGAHVEITDAHVAPGDDADRLIVTIATRAAD